MNRTNRSLTVAAQRTSEPRPLGRGCPNFLNLIILLTLALCPLFGAEQHGLVKFGGLPVPGATVTASQGEKKFVAITDPQGAYSFADLQDGVWAIQVEMLCFSPIRQDVNINASAPTPEWELKLLPLDEIKAAAGPLNPTTPASTQAKTPGAFQRTGLNQSASQQAPAPPTAETKDPTPKTLHRFLINRTINNRPTPPFL